VAEKSWPTFLFFPGLSVGGQWLSGGRMPYVFVRENAIKYWCTVQGLNHNEIRILAEKVRR